MEKNINQVTEINPETTPMKENPYANGKGRAIVERLIRESREFRENVKREYEQNPEIRKMYDRLEQKTKMKDGNIQ